MNRKLVVCSVAGILLLAPALGAAPFKRGDANADAIVDISDFVYVLNFLFLGGPPPGCEDAADANDDAAVDISDASYGLNYLFLGGPAPPPPGPLTAGFDGTPDDPFTCGDPEEEPSPVEEIVDVPGTVGGFSVDPSGQFALAVSPETRSGAVIDLRTGRTLGEFPTGMNPGPVRFGADGRTAIVLNLGTLAAPATEITALNLSDPSRVTARLVRLGPRVFDARYAPALPRAVVLGAGTDEAPSDRVFLVDAAQGEVLASMALGFRPKAVDFTDDGEVAVMVGELPDPQRNGAQRVGGIAALNVRTGAVVVGRGIGPAPLPVDVKVLGNFAFVTDGTQTGPAVVKLDGLNPVATLGRGRQGELLLRSDGRRGYVLSQARNEVLIFDPGTMREIKTIPIGEPDSDPVDVPSRTREHILLALDEKLLLAVNHENHLIGIDTVEDSLLGQVSLDPRRLDLPVETISLAAGGDSIAVAFSDGFIGATAISRIDWRRLEIPEWRLIPIPIDRITISGDTCIDDIAILVDDGQNAAGTSFVDAANQEQMQNVFARFYTSFPDVFDFVVAFYGSEFGNVTSPGAFAWSWTLRNFTRGLNRGIGNGINGSGTMVTNAGTNRVQCLIWENDLNEYDDQMQCINIGTNVFGNFRDGLAILGQEVLHRWSTRLDVTGKGCSILRNAAHYHQFFNCDASVVGGSQGFRIRDDGGGNFTRTAVEAIISQYDEYLMGFREPENVSQALFCVQNPSAVNNNSFTGTRRNITMNDITSENGARTPGASLSQRHFNVAYVLVVPNQNHVLIADLDEIKAFRDAFTVFFETQTNRRGFLNTRICPLPFTRPAGEIATDNSPSNIAVAPNGRWAYVANLNANNVQVIDLDQASPTYETVIDTIPVGGRATGLAFRGDSNRAYVGLLDQGRLDVINTATRAVAGSIPTGSEPVNVFINRVGFGWVTNRADDDMTIFRPNVGDALGEIDVGDRPQGISGSFDSEVTVITNRNDDTVTVHGTRTAIQRTVNVGDNPIAVDVAQYESLPNQTEDRANDLPSPVALAYVANVGSGTVTVIDITTDPDNPASFTAAAIDTIEVGSSPIDVKFAPGGAIALVANRASGTVSVIEVASHSVIDTVNLAPGVQSIAFSADGKKAYVTNEITDTVTVLE